MPFPSLRPDESEQEYVSRFIGEMKKEFPDAGQAAAVVEARTLKRT